VSGNCKHDWKPDSFPGRIKNGVEHCQGIWRCALCRRTRGSHTDSEAETLKVYVETLPVRKIKLWRGRRSKV
jgi:hypothetical protein